MSQNSFYDGAGPHEHFSFLGVTERRVSIFAAIEQLR